MTTDRTVTEPNADLTEHGYLHERYQYLQICTRCYHLYETGRPDGLVQRCRCRKDAKKRWPGHDYNERASLCHCCGVHVLHSGSRWSAYFCRECQLLVMGISVWERRLVFPTGRHTLMHTWVPKDPKPDPTTPSTEAGAQRILDTLKVISVGADQQRWWYATIMRRNLDRLRFSGDASLLDYMSAVHREQLDVLRTRLEALAELSQLVRLHGNRMVHGGVQG
jgi:hypothetical protein